MGRQGTSQAGPGGSARPAGSSYLELRLPRGKAGAEGPAAARAPQPCRPVLRAGLACVLRAPRLDFRFIAFPQELGFLPDASPAADQASVGAAEASRDARVVWRGLPRRRRGPCLLCSGWCPAGPLTFLLCASVPSPGASVPVPLSSIFLSPPPFCSSSPPASLTHNLAPFLRLRVVF